MTREDFESSWARILSLAIFRDSDGPVILICGSFFDLAPIFRRDGQDTWHPVAFMTSWKNDSARVSVLMLDCSVGFNDIDCESSASRRFRSTRNLSSIHPSGKTGLSIRTSSIGVASVGFSASSKCSFDLSERWESATLCKVFSVLSCLLEVKLSRLGLVSFRLDVIPELTPDEAWDDEVDGDRLDKELARGFSMFSRSS